MIIKALVLAAGSSSRLGQIKQLVHHHEKPLLKRVIDQLTSLSLDTHVVLGAHAETILAYVYVPQYTINPHWQRGMGNTLSFGMKQLPACDAVLVALTDQVLIPTTHYASLLAAYLNHPNHIIATQHQSLGAPTIFPQKLFSQLIKLDGDTGAKNLMKSHPVQTVHCPLAAHDLDTTQDLSLLNS